MKQVTAILIGAGARGALVYASYALRYPNELKFIGVAEPDEGRRADFQRQHHIPQEQTYNTWEEILKQPRMADCVLICTQDRMHMGAVRAAMEKGYHILCEKPITPFKEELLEMKKLAADYDGIISICHVLRYSPFFIQLKNLLRAGTVGELVSVQHMECVGYWHMAHSFVRGNWADSRETSPMILQKCCHDFDILLYLTGASVSRLSSFGSLVHFKEENAPQGAPGRCTDGCPHRDECPFFAPRFYLEHENGREFARTVRLGETAEEILERLADSPYGRCVYHCGNNVVDHQVVNLEFDNRVTASVTMCAFTHRCERVITLCGTRGQITGHMEDNLIVWNDFVTGHETRYTLHTNGSGHNGSDDAMMKEFTALVASGGRQKNRSSALEAIDSHLIALAAEESRQKDGAVLAL